MPSKTDLPDIAQHKRNRPPKGAWFMDDEGNRTEQLNAPACTHILRYPHKYPGWNFPATRYTLNRHICK